MRPKRMLIISALACAAVANAPTDISDRLRFEIALAQRDYVIAKAQFEAAAARMQAKTAEAERLCAEAGKRYSPEQFACVAPQGDSNAR